VDVIALFSNLEELNLSNNLFTQLPPDLTSWHSIANLNLSNIEIADFEYAVTSLATMPSLKSLYVNLFVESQVDLIMRYLPELEFLNGLPVDRDALNDSQEK
jgi:Leucine-rich repeat (LRR) protein